MEHKGFGDLNIKSPMSKQCFVSGNNKLPDLDMTGVPHPQ